jgi:hypothetical protein
MAEQTPKRQPRPRVKRARKNLEPGASPTAARDPKDPGDATARNYRYQHSYGVMLIAAARRGERPYVALWCEHHEDFLAERTDGRFDAYQVKTSKPELGPWTTTDREVIRAIGRFVDLISEFGPSIASVFFVSNTECDTVSESNTDDRRRGHCPVQLLNHIRLCDDVDSISSPYRSSFDELQAACGCDAQVLFAALRRMDIIVGPSRGEFDAALSHEHLAQLAECRGLDAAGLDGVRDGLVATVYRASSLQVTDPLRHLHPVIDRTLADPVLVAKRLDVAAVIESSLTSMPTFTRFVGPPRLALGSTRPEHVLQEKLGRGGLTDQVGYMKERELAAEYHLLEDAARRPHLYPDLLRQVEELVLGECSEAHLRARQHSEPYGETMLIDVQDRLRRVAEQRAHSVGGHDYECLIGIAGLLTSECRVWWSARFQPTAGAN